MGNESSLNECPTEDAPSNCGEVCARVNCLPANTSPVVQAHSSTQIASEMRQVVKPSLTSSQRAVKPSLTSSQRAVKPSLTSSQRAVKPSLTSSQRAVKPSLTSSQRAVKPSLTSSQRAVIASLKGLQPLTYTLLVTETPQSSSSIRKMATSVTGPQFESPTEKESDSVLTITLIGVITMVMVVAGTAVSVCLIVCRVKKKGSSSIVTGDNMAYMEPKQSMRIYIKKNPAYSDVPPVEPIYENLEE